MAFDLDAFRNKFASGGARASQFSMQITWPDAVRGIAGVVAAEAAFSFLCTMAALPSEDIGMAPVFYFGRILKYAGDRKYDQPLHLTILNDEDFLVRKALESWSGAISARQSTVSQFDGGISTASFVTDGVVTQLSRNNGGAAIKAYKFVGMWPQTIGEIRLGWEQQDVIETYTVSFAYQYWLPVDPATGAVLA